MPLNNNDFNWRPNDNSGLTLLRFKLETDKWYNAVRNAQLHGVRSIGRDLSFFLSLFQLLFCLLLLILLLFINILKSLLSMFVTEDYNNHEDKIVSETKPVRKNYNNENDYLDALSIYFKSQR